MAASAATAILALLLTVPAAAQSKAESDLFEKRIRPLLSKHCYECHSTTEGPRNGDLILERVADLVKGGSRGPILDRDHWQNGLLWKVVSYSDSDLQMPPDGRLPDDEIELIRSWLKQGAELPEYRPQDVRRNQQFDMADRVARLWSLQPIQPIRPPRPVEPTRIHQPLDLFIAKRLAERGLSLSSEADRRTLIRRLTFDLTGLPPTPESVRQFVLDPRPDAMEHLVDRLLNSPRFGERWARFWLDLARYTDTTASWLDGTGQAWLYRDWVVRAMNENMGYDEFLSRQLAADLMDLPPTELAALGYLGLSPTYWKELKLSPDVIRVVVAEEWDERIDTVSRTFLGMTVACARCHDHKFDPISIRDYYGLAGVFASSQFDHRPLLTDAQVKEYRNVHRQFEQLEKQLGKLEEKQGDEARKIEQQMAQLRSSIPFFNAPTAHVMRESSLYVRSDGPDRTRLEYRDGEARDLPVFRRGQPGNPGDVVPRGFPEALSRGRRREFEQGSGRLELARAMLDDARDLTARVIVNRIWREHFGQGLVRTPSNFGMQGERPTHPELLDFLAAEFIERGWNLKWLHRTIVLSATWRQRSVHDQIAFEVDPENHLLWRMPRRRLPVEMWRDALLLVSGALDDRLTGPAQPVESPDNHRRTLYGLIARRELNQMLRIHDFPEPTAHSPGRSRTITPLQQLYVLNAPFLADQAQRILRRLPDRSLDAQLNWLYEQVYSRSPAAEETELARRYLSGSTVPDSHSVAPTKKRWLSYIHALLSLNEFLFID